MENENNKKDLFNGHILSSIIAFLLVLVMVAVLLRFRMVSLFNTFIEHQVERQAVSLAELSYEKLGSELDNLQYVAEILENDEDVLYSRIMLLSSPGDGIKKGLIGIDGRFVYVEEVDMSKYPGIENAFRGERSISVDSEGGILFSCPVFRNKNVHYCLYEYFPRNTLNERFNINIYEGLGKAVIITKDEQVVIPFEGVSAEDIAFFESDSVRNTFSKMHTKMEISASAAELYKSKNGNYYLYEAEIPETDFILIGRIEQRVVEKGLANMNVLVYWVFGLLMLLVAIGSFYLVFASEKVRASDEFKKARDAAEEANRAKSDFLANMSHEIRTPINAILGIDEMILREYKEDKLSEYATNIKNAGNSLLSIINDVLDFSKIEAGKLELSNAEYDTAEFISEIVNMISDSASKKSLDFKVNVNSELPSLLYGDSARIRQCAINILNNSVKYTEEGTVSLDVDFKGLDSRSISLIFTIKDTGIGMKEEDLQRIFNPFERFDMERNRTIEGTGLGMSIVQQLLKLMNGKLNVKSEYGKGSEFSFSVRQWIKNNKPIGDFDEALKKTQHRENNYNKLFTAAFAKILIVDDTELNLTVAKGLLKDTLIQIDTAYSGREALALIEKNTYDLMLIDHRMPGMDGVELLHAIRELSFNPNRNKPCIALTANAIAGVREEYLKEGFNDYMSKPINGVKLEEMLLKYLPVKKVIRYKSVEEMKESNKDSLGAEGNAAVAEEKNDGLPLWIRTSRILDFEAGIANCGSVQGYMDALKIFCESVNQKALEIVLYLDEGDIENYTTKVHALKSSARIVGATELSYMAAELEAAGNNEDTRIISERTGDMMSLYRQYSKYVANFADNAKRADNDEKPDITEDMLKDAYLSIRDYAESYDYDLIKMVLESLEDYRIPDNDRQIFNEIGQKLESMDYEGIKELIKTH